MGHPVSDDQLATEGMQLRNQGRVLLIACGALAREILALMKANDWQHMDLQCLRHLSQHPRENHASGQRLYRKTPG